MVVQDLHPLALEDVLTQRDTSKVDPTYDREVPKGTFVVVHSTISVYNNSKAKNKAFSFNLCALQVLAVPTFG